MGSFFKRRVLDGEPGGLKHFIWSRMVLIASSATFLGIVANPWAETI